MPDVSALGAAYLAGLKAGVYKSIEQLKKLNAEKSFYSPVTDSDKVNEGYTGWQKARHRRSVYY